MLVSPSVPVKSDFLLVCKHDVPWSCYQIATEAIPAAQVGPWGSCPTTSVCSPCPRPSVPSPQLTPGPCLSSCLPWPVPHLQIPAGVAVLGASLAPSWRGDAGVHQTLTEQCVLSLVLRTQRQASPSSALREPGGGGHPDCKTFCALSSQAFVPSDTGWPSSCISVTFRFTRNK